MDKATAALFERARSLAEPALAQRRHEFAVRLATIAGDAIKARAFGGSGHDLRERAEYSHELAARATLIVEWLNRAHDAMNASGNEATRGECRKWTAQRIHEEADELAGMMRKPNAAFGEHFEPRNLKDETTREIEGAYAVINQHFDTINATRARTAGRTAQRWLAALRAFLRV